MTQRRRFTPEFKAQVVLDVLTGNKSAAEVCREHQLNPQVLARWKTEVVERAPFVFEQEQVHGPEQVRQARVRASSGSAHHATGDYKKKPRCS